MKKISIVIPTKNEAEVLADCLTSIESQVWDGIEHEIIIVDGHSDDGTREIAETLGCKVLMQKYNPKGIGSAKNIGIKHSSGEFIFFTDADCVVPSRWVSGLLAGFEDDDKIASVGGANVTPKDDIGFAVCVGKVFELLSKAGPRYAMLSEKKKDTFHNPGCNVAYKKSVLEEVGLFNEELVTCEDEEIDYRIIEKGYRIVYLPDTPVDHYRRSSWEKLIKQAYRYAVGRMQAIKMHRGMGKWYHYFIMAMFFLAAVLLPASFFCRDALMILLSLLLTGAAGIIIMGLFLAVSTDLKYFFNYTGIITLWFIFSGIGYIKGVFK